MLAIKVLSLTCSATGCERNWSIVDHVHSKKRNRLEQKRLNALVFVKYNIQLDLRQQERVARGESYDPICLSDLESDDEWITEEEFPCFPTENTWKDIYECFQDDIATNKRKRGIYKLHFSLAFACRCRVRIPGGAISCKSLGQSWVLPASLSSGRAVWWVGFPTYTKKKKIDKKGKKKVNEDVNLIDDDMDDEIGCEIEGEDEEEEEEEATFEDDDEDDSGINIDEEPFFDDD